MRDRREAADMRAAVASLLVEAARVEALAAAATVVPAAAPVDDDDDDNEPFAIVEDGCASPAASQSPAPVPTPAPSPAPAPPPPSQQRARGRPPGTGDFVFRRYVSSTLKSSLSMN